jgi:NAD(P)-dependent dehydrogenase (short-subunit alcohol dehydrogenase family)
MVTKNLNRFSSLFDLSGRVAIVTGAATGNGGGIAIALAEAGATVIQTDIKFDENCVKAGKQVLMDVTDEEQVRETFKKISGEFGSIDILVNNAGIIYKALIDDIDLAQFQKVMDINLNGTVICTKHAVPYMKERKWGRIVNIASSQSYLSNPTYSAYSASKTAVSHLTRIWGLELAPFGILINSLCPSYVRTQMLEAGIAKRIATEGITHEQGIKDWADLVPLNRVLEIQEIGNWTLVLCSELAMASTGSNFAITCGQVRL